jgi:hypothetical protein
MTRKQSGEFLAKIDQQCCFFEVAGYSFGRLGARMVNRLASGQVVLITKIKF